MDLLERSGDGRGEVEEPTDRQRLAEQPLERDTGEVFAHQGRQPIVRDQHERAQDTGLVEIAGDLDLVSQPLQLSLLVRLRVEHLQHHTTSIRPAARPVEQRVFVVTKRLGDLEARFAHF